MEHDMRVALRKADMMSDSESSREIKLNETASDNLYVYIDYEDEYVQPLIIEAIQSYLPSGSYTLISSVDELPSSTAPYLHIGAYESLPFEHIMIHPKTSMVNAYVIRKALIRKHYLGNTVQGWIAKQPDSILAKNVKPSCSFELDYAEFLDDALVEAWELRASFEVNATKRASEREWWILKPGMSDRGQGIRLFSTQEQLQAIFEHWETNRPASDIESESEGSNADINEDKLDGEVKAKDYIITSHLRHFLAQPYIHPPLLLPDDQRKFHIRTYVLAIGALQVYVYKPMLALFASRPYVPPWSSTFDTEMDLAPHLTNTCLQTSSSPSTSTASPFNSSAPSVKLLSSLLFPPTANLKSILEQIFALTAESFEAAARSQSIHFQPLPNCFEVFGLDFLVDAHGKAWLLECNAFPDFGQTGEQLRGVVSGFWGEVMRVVGRWWRVEQGMRMNDTKEPGGEAELVLVREVDLGRR